MVMGIIVSWGLFVSVLLHELSHSLVANKKGFNVDSIVFFIFGGVSNIEIEPESAGSEFIIAIAGPACSVVLGGILFLIATLVVNPETPTPLAVVLTYLAFTNWVLAVFNIIPGFPLDGGRVLRSIIWAVTKNLHRATLIAGNVGRVFGWLLILFGVTQILGGNSGYWSPAFLTVLDDTDRLVFIQCCRQRYARTKHEGKSVRNEGERCDGPQPGMCYAGRIGGKCGEGLFYAARSALFTGLYRFRVNGYCYTDGYQEGTPGGMEQYSCAADNDAQPSQIGECR
jgi:Zn-dependent protease